MKFKNRGVLIGSLVLLAVATAVVVYGAISLSVSFSDPTIACNSDGTATVTFGYTVTSGDSSAATVTGSVDAGTPFALTGINAGSGTGAWTINGSTKTADGSYSTTLTDGQHTFTVCATQPGSGGNPDKTGCATQTVTINCPATSGCDTTEVFGEVPANKNLCLANGTIQIQFRGNFGETANLEIDGPNNFSLAVAVNRAGDSCNYHYNWDPGTGNGGAGGYTFKVTGNNQPELDFTATLECTVHGH